MPTIIVLGVSDKDNAENANMPHHRRTPRASWPVVVALVLVTPSCAHSNPHTESAFIDGNAPITLTVHNANWQDMRVYPVRGDGSIGPRVATVPSLSTERVRLRLDETDRGTVRLLLKPLASSDGYVTNALMAGPGQAIQLRVTNALRLSYLTPINN